MLVTVLLPEHAGEEDLRAIMADVHQAASELGIEVLGGHTEVTPGLSIPIVSTTAVGRAPKDRYVTSSGARAGDDLLLTKRAGLEGTAILATDFEDRLIGRPGAGALARAQACRQEISVVPEGMAAAAMGASAMHDVTEGGVLGAIYEMVGGLRAGGGDVRRLHPRGRGDPGHLRLLRRRPPEADLQRRHADRLPGRRRDGGGPGGAGDHRHRRRSRHSTGVRPVGHLPGGCRDLEISYRDELWRILETGRGSL